MADGTSDRTQRRNAQRQRTMGGHPASIGRLPQATEMGQGQLFNDPFTRPREKPNLGSSPGFGIPQGWGRPQGRPRYPGQGGGPHPQEPGPQPPAQQMQLPFQKPEAEPGFADRGLGKYYMRNKNGGQFNKPAIVGAVHNTIEKVDDARFFMHAGMGEALRHTVGLDPNPSHRSDDIRSRRHAAERERALSGEGTTGINPQTLHAEFQHIPHAGHPPSAFEPGLSW